MFLILYMNGPQGGKMLNASQNTFQANYLAHLWQREVQMCMLFCRCIVYNKLRTFLLFTFVNDLNLFWVYHFGNCLQKIPKRGANFTSCPGHLKPTLGHCHYLTSKEFPLIMILHLRFQWRCQSIRKVLLLSPAIYCW